MCTFWRAVPDLFNEEAVFTRESNLASPYLPKTDHTNWGQYNLKSKFFSLHKPAGRVKAGAFYESFIESEVVFDGKKSADCYIRLWFNIIGRDLNKFQLKILRRISYGQGDADFIPVTTLEPEMIAFWFRQAALVSADNKQANFKIVISGVIPNNNWDGGSVNVDDIALTPECQAAPKGTKLPGEEPTPSPFIDCPEGTHPCANNQSCYNNIERCDFVDNCGDGTDEKGLVLKTYKFKLSTKLFLV